MRKTYTFRLLRDEECKKSNVIIAKKPDAQADISTHIRNGSRMGTQWISVSADAATSAGCFVKHNFEKQNKATIRLAVISDPNWIDPIPTLGYNMVLNFAKRSAERLFLKETKADFVIETQLKELDAQDKMLLQVFAPSFILEELYRVTGKSGLSMSGKEWKEFHRSFNHYMDLLDGAMNRACLTYLDMERQDGFSAVFTAFARAKYLFNKANLEH